MYGSNTGVRQGGSMRGCVSDVAASAIAVDHLWGE